jgi:hypothetical protein
METYHVLGNLLDAVKDAQLLHPILLALVAFLVGPLEPSSLPNHCLLPFFLSHEALSGEVERKWREHRALLDKLQCLLSASGSDG